MRLGICYCVAAAIGVVLAVLCGAYTVIGPFSLQEPPVERAFKKLQLSSQDLRRMPDAETIHVALNRGDNKSILTILQVMAEDLQMSREELLRASRVMSSRRKAFRLIYTT